MDVTLDLMSKRVCPHCDKPLDLRYFSDSCELKFICSDGCKAEYDAVVDVGKTTELPICGAKRVQTFGH